MCELFGMSCNSQDRATFSLKKFANHSWDHPHGWGVAYYENGKAQIPKKPEMAKDSPDYFKTIDNAKSNIIIAHIRCATQGAVCSENCHPFKREFINRDWVFAHNGNIENLPLHERAAGDTDSESAFHYIIDKIGEYTSSQKIGGIYPGIKKGIRYIFDEYRRKSTLNFLMSDGTLLYAFNHYKSKPMYFLKRSKIYGNTFLVSTINDLIKGEDWKQIPRDRLLVICNGEVLLLSDKL